VTGVVMYFCLFGAYYLVGVDSVVVFVWTEICIFFQAEDGIRDRDG